MTNSFMTQRSLRKVMRETWAYQLRMVGLKYREIAEHLVHHNDPTKRLSVERVRQICEAGRRRNS